MKKLPTLDDSLGMPAKASLMRRYRGPLSLATERQDQRWSNLRKDLYLLLLIVGISLPLIFVHQVLAAEVEINDLPYGADGDSHNGSSPTVVFTTDQIGYAFYRGGFPSIGNCVYSKTTNGGTSWGSPVTVDAQTDCVKIAVWYDRWTPGDNSGTNIHILTADSSSDDLWYTRLDTAASDSLTTTVNATGANQGGSFTAETSVPSITKGTDGDIYMGILDDGDTFVIKCTATCETAANWSEAGTLVIAPDNDWLILMPLSVGNNIMAIRYDLSLATPDVEYQIYTDSTNLWGGTWLDIDSDAPVDTLYDAAFGATVNKATGTIYLAYAAQTDTLNDGNDDVRTASFSGAVWTPKTNVVTDTSRGVVGVKIATKENTDAVYVVYTVRNTSGVPNSAGIHWKVSTDAMQTWGTEQGPLNTLSNTDIFGARVNIMSTERIYATWFDFTNADLLGNTVADLTTTAVEMADFTAHTSNQGVLLEWRTGFEVDNLGFNLYREQNGKRTLVNPSIIAGSALVVAPRIAMTAGDSYSWLDPQGSSDSIYYLEDIDIDGTRQLHAPVVPAKGREPARSKSKRAMLLSELNATAGKQAEAHSSQRGWAVPGFAAKSNASAGDFSRAGVSGKDGSPPSLDTSFAEDDSFSIATTARSRVGSELLTIGKGTSTSGESAKRQRLLAGMPGLKLSVREDGWYRATQAELVAAGLNPNTDMRSLQLYNEGVVVPIKINSGKNSGPLEAGDSIEFYGQGMDTPSTDTRQYWLISSMSPGRRINAQTMADSSPNGSAQSFDYTVERKERHIYFSGLLNGDAENFFGAVVGTSPIAQTLSLKHFHAAASAPSQLEVALQGMTTAEHVVKVQLNGTEVGLIRFDGMARKVAQLSIDSGLLHEGDNTVTLERTNGDSDISLVDYLRVTYAHTYQADDDYLQFTVNGNAKVSGFSAAGIRLLDITDPKSISFYTPQTESSADGYRFSITTSQARTFLALTEPKTRQLAAITRNQPSNWSMANGADFVIITHRNFINSVEPLASLRRSEGMSVAVVDVEDVYDEFSFGAHSPQAVRSFLQWTRSNWQQKPKYVLFVGQGSYDPRRYLSNQETDFVPARLIDTALLETVSDDWFVDFDNDGVPEMAIGRLPVRTAADATAMISKTINYAADKAVQSALMVADTTDAKTQFSFASASDELSALLPTDVGVERIFRGSNAAAAVHDQIINGINQGPLLVSFIGHGSVETWTGAALLSTLDAPALTNGQRLPVFLMMTCLNGYYQNPTRESLAQSLLRNDKGGAVAVWASSGMTEPQSQLGMSKALYRELFGGQPQTLGEAIRKAKGANVDRDVLRTWALLGDPTLQLRPTGRQAPAPDR